MRQLRIDERKIAFLRAVKEVYGDEVNTITREQMTNLKKSHGISDPTWLWQSDTYKVGKGIYRIPDELLTIMRSQPTNGKGTPMAAPSLIAIDDATKEAVQDVGTHNYGINDLKFDDNFAAFVPPEDPLYVPFGNYYDVATITDSGKFFPYWIFGLSGNGKTLSVEQAHAKAKKKLIMCPISREADEDSLLGGLRLLNGNTVPFVGPVTMAAILGVTICLDEIDQGDEKMMCLQTALQNRPFLIKRFGKMIYPQPGFNIVATANTKGQGSDDGKFIGANVMNEAMLDRFVNVFEQDYPGEDVEKQILLKVLLSLNHASMKEEEFVTRLLDWAKASRIAFKDGASQEVITTRRLVGIIRSYDMYGKDRIKAVSKSISRFKDHVQSGLLDTYKLIDADWNKKETEKKRKEAAIKSGIDPETAF